MSAVLRYVSLLELTPRYGSRVLSVISRPPNHTALFSILAHPRSSMLSCALLPYDSQSSSRFPLRAVQPRIHVAALSTDVNKGLDSLQNLLTHAHMRREIDLKEELLPPEYLTPERRLIRMYETLYIVFSYIRQNEGEDAGMQSLHDFEFKPADEGTETYQAREAVVAVISSIVHNYSRISLSAPTRTQHPQIFDILRAIIALHDMYIRGQQNLVLKDWTEMWGRALPMLIALSSAIDQAELVHGKDGEGKTL